MATHTLQPGSAPANDPTRREPTEDFSGRIADVAAVMAQARDVLDLIGSYGDLDRPKGGACYGAATIVRAAIDELGGIEVDIRALERRT